MPRWRIALLRHSMFTPGMNLARSISGGRHKNDPKLVEAARELRDRYLEQVNTNMLLPPSACGKYDVSRQLEGAPSSMKVEPVALLKAA